jgi:hypothetical protein
MRWLREWRSGPITALIIAWIICSGTTLTLFIVARVRSAEREYADMGFRAGGSLVAVRINWAGALPGLLTYYAVLVLLPPTLLFLLWRRARRDEGGADIPRMEDAV